MSIVVKRESSALIDSRAPVLDHHDLGTDTLTPRPELHVLAKPYMGESKRRNKKRKVEKKNAALFELDGAEVALPALDAWLCKELAALQDAAVSSGVMPFDSPGNDDPAMVKDEELQNQLVAACTSISSVKTDQPLTITADCCTNLDQIAGKLVDAAEVAVMVHTKTHSLVIPRLASFLLSDITHIDRLLSTQPFHLIVMDPPWENGSQKRSQAYQSLRNHELVPMPVNSLLVDGGYVAVWVTNKSSVVKFVTEQLFTAWHLQHVAEWQWVKITSSGQPVVPFASSHKRPYERLIIGRKTVRGCAVTSLPQQFCFASVPSQCHSRKPFLQELLYPFLPEKPRCLELFARNLTAGWTSWGNQVLLHQDSRLYQSDTMQ